MTTFGWDTSTSTASTNMDYYYNDTLRDRAIKRKSHLSKSESRRPLAHLKLKEEDLKDPGDKPSDGMPTELILFDPKDLVLGGKNK